MKLGRHWWELRLKGMKRRRKRLEYELGKLENVCWLLLFELGKSLIRISQSYTGCALAVAEKMIRFHFFNIYIFQNIYKFKETKREREKKNRVRSIPCFFVYPKASGHSLACQIHKPIFIFPFSKILSFLHSIYSSFHFHCLL